MTDPDWVPLLEKAAAVITDAVGVRVMRQL